MQIERLPCCKYIIENKNKIQLSQKLRSKKKKKKQPDFFYFVYGVKQECLTTLKILHVLRNVAMATQSNSGKRHPCQRLPKVLQCNQEYELLSLISFLH